MCPHADPGLVDVLTFESETDHVGRQSAVQKRLFVSVFNGVCAVAMILGMVLSWE